MAKASYAGRALLTPNPKSRLREQVREVLRFHHYSLRTEKAYWQWIRRYLVFCRDHPHLTQIPHPQPLSHPMGEGSVGLSRPSAGAEKRWRHPREMGAPEAARFLSHLALAVRRVSLQCRPSA